MKYQALAASLIAASLLTACGGSSSGGDDTSDPINIENVQKVLDTNADIAWATYSDAVDTAEALKLALQDFREDPTQANFDAAKKAWLVAREPYGQTEVYRFRLSPIDSTDYESEDGPEGDINAWPLGEALIDYVVTATGDDDFGTDEIGVTANSAGINGNGAIDEDHAKNNQADNIIGNTSVLINADLLANTATATDEHDVIAGYHAIEFLLWGQDLNDEGDVTLGDDRDDAVKTHDASNLASGGQRPLSDFDDGYNTSDDPYNPNNLKNRRHKYLEVAVDKLIEDLTAVRDGWEDGVADNYRDKFTTISTRAEAIQRLKEILTGMGTLSEGELAGERMQISFSANSQEDEHSCFSDNTHRDIWLDAEGVSNSYYGEYAGYDSTLDGTDDNTVRAVSGYGLDDYLADAGLTELKGEIEDALTLTETNYGLIDSAARNGSPVDVLIMDANRDSNNPMYKTILSLNAQAGIIADIAEALDISDSVVDDDASECDTSNPSSTCP